MELGHVTVCLSACSDNFLPPSGQQLITTCYDYWCLATRERTTSTVHRKQDIQQLDVWEDKKQVEMTVYQSSVIKKIVFNIVVISVTIF